MEMLQLIRAKVASLQPGQAIAFDRNTMREIGPKSHLAGAITMLAQLGTPADQVLEGITGSAYEWFYRVDHYTGNTIFQRLKEPVQGNLRTYVSPDRRHRFRQRGDEFWECIEQRR